MKLNPILLPARKTGISALNTLGNFKLELLENFYPLALRISNTVNDFIAFIFAHKKKDNKSNIDSLENFGTHNTASISELILKGQEEERGRIAKDIHDSLGSILSSTKHSLSDLRNKAIWSEEGLKIYSKSIELIDLSMQEMRKVSQNLMPELLEKFGLIESLKDFCIRTTNEKCKVYLSESLLNELISNDKEIVVYRIIQELVTNSLKHGEASMVNITLCNEDNLVSVTVEDNGRGFDTAKLETAKGVGWLNVVARANYIGGKIDVKSDSIRGTYVNIQFHSNIN